MLYRQPAKPHVHRMGPFTIRRIFPGASVPGHDDRGYAALAAVDDATLEPGTLVAMHEHRNDEIVSYVHQGSMRHDDSTGTKLDINARNLMVMNAGRSFWHEERTLSSDATTRTLQIFIRPHTVDLEPKLQHLPLDEPPANEWRYLTGPEGSDAPTTVRNNIMLFDGHLAADATLPLPARADWDTYFVVLRGSIQVQDQTLRAVESALLKDERGAGIEALEESLVVVFLIDPAAKLTYRGTIGN